MALRSDNSNIQAFIEKSMVDLPALPTVIVQVLQATDRDTVTTNEIEALLSTDAAITIKLLKVVNSAYFGLPRQVDSIGHTITILGLTQVRNLVLSVGVLNALSSPSPKSFELQRAFWQHSFGSATCAQSIARRKGLGSKDQDLVFVGALLHDIGRLFLFTLFTQPYMQVLSDSARLGEAVTTTEERVLGVNHAELGGILAQKWNFPDQLSRLIRSHEAPAGTDDAEALPLLYSVHIADRLACESWEGGENAETWPWCEDATKWLGYNQEQMEELRAEMVEFTAKAKELMGVL